MNDVAPDLVDAVIGFRQWRLRGSELWSLRGTDRWHRGVQTAACDEGAHAEPAPANGCSCGIYALYGPMPRGASAATPGEPAPARLYAVADGYAGRSPARFSGPCRARVIPGHEFERICERALESGWTAPTDAYLAAHGVQDHFTVLPRAFTGTATGDRRVVIAFPCEGIPLTKLVQGHDGSRGPVVSAADLLTRDYTVVEVSLADLNDTRPAFVRERWFEAFVVERVTKRLAK
jgi:hypothetical protein